jgi:hypothetical protein
MARTQVLPKGKHVGPESIFLRRNALFAFRRIGLPSIANDLRTSWSESVARAVAADRNKASGRPE